MFNLVLQKAGDSPPQNATQTPPEMRVTRTVAKSVAEAGGELWLLGSASANEAKTPVKKRGRKAEVTVPFEAVEFPEEEADEDYDPSKDVADISDEESVASASDTGTPMSSSIMSTPPSMSGLASNSTKTPNSFAKEVFDSTDTFKKPQEAVSGVVRSLNFDESATRRATRSTANLKEVSIEELDTKFDPPDITEDMYDNVFDDYTLFLAETYGKPVEKKAPQEEASKESEAEEEENEDPDYVYNEQEELYEVLDEYQYNRSTKITQKEAELLLQDVIEAYDVNVQQEEQLGKAKQIPNSKAQTQPQQAYVGNVQESYHSGIYYGGFELSNDQRLIIGQQMRQHIQLLTQMSLLTSKDVQWQELHSDCRNMLSELMSRSYSCQYSIYAQDNLYSSINLLSEWDGCFARASQQKETKHEKKSKKFELTDELVNFIADKPAFIYPELLPTCALKPIGVGCEEKPYFAKAEDDLIALALEHFYGGSERWKKGKTGLTDAYTYISSRYFKVWKAMKNFLETKILLHFSIQPFQPIICIYRMGNFVHYH